MDIVSILNSPAGVAVITALGVIIGARVSAVLGIRTGAGGHVASLDNSHHNHVTQTTQHHVEHHDNRVYHAPPASVGRDLDPGEIFALGFGLMVLVAAVVWLLAIYWGVVSVVLPIVVGLLALLLAVAAGGYPHDTGRKRYLLGSALAVGVAGWAVPTFPSAVEGIPSLTEIAILTQGAPSYVEGVTMTFQALGPLGMNSYLLRMAGMGLAFLVLLGRARDAVAFALIARGRRIGEEGMQARGFRWSGVKPEGWVDLATLVAILALVALFAYPGAVLWIPAFGGLIGGAKG